jgi:hypothetical protein
LFHSNSVLTKTFFVCFESQKGPYFMLSQNCDADKVCQKDHMRQVVLECCHSINVISEFCMSDM